MAALTCADTAPSGSHARSTWEYARWVRSGHNGTRHADLAEREPGPLTIIGVNDEAPLHHASQTSPQIGTEAIGDTLMPDARYPDRWLNDRRIRRLSDRAHRVFVTSMAWSVSNRTDGRIEPDDVDELPVVPDLAVGDELVRSGLWERDGDDLLITVFIDTQSSAAQLDALDAKRATDRERQARHRRSKRVTRDVTRDTTRDAEARQGQARTGELPPPTTNGLGQCRTCDHREPLGPDGRCRSCVEWDVQEEVR